MNKDNMQLLSEDAHAGGTAATILDRLDLERLEISHRISADPKRSADLGQ